MGRFAKSTTTLSIFAILLTLSSGSVDEDDAFKRSLENFSHKIFQELSQSHRKINIIYSPFSIQTCLAMARMGADGETAKEMDDALGFTSGQTLETVADNYYALLTRYENSSILHLANKFYVMDGYEPSDQYNVVLATKFLSPVESIDFQQNEKAVSTINDWVKSKTNNKIEELVSSKQISGATRLVLLSAIHFNGKWEKPFLLRKTSNRPFYIDETNTVEVPTMHKTDYIVYGRFPELNATAIRLLYKDSDFSMLIFLPNALTGLADMEAKLKDIELDTLTQQMSKKKVTISLPKFKAEFRVDLNSTLRKLGMNSIFGSSNFSKMLKSSQPLSISNVLHMAFIDVNESGTEAAATTGLAAMAVSMPKKFRADHPFHYMIVNTENTILFQGNVVSI